VTQRPHVNTGLHNVAACCTMARRPAVVTAAVCSGQAACRTHVWQSPPHPPPLLLASVDIAIGVGTSTIPVLAGEFAPQHEQRRALVHIR
jgi:hypothetical protein